MQRRHTAPAVEKSHTAQLFRPTALGHLQAIPAPSTRFVQVNGARHSRPSAWMTPNPFNELQWGFEWVSQREGGGKKKEKT